MLLPIYCFWGSPLLKCVDDKPKHLPEAVFLLFIPASHSRTPLAAELNFPGSFMLLNKFYGFKGACNYLYKLLTLIILPNLHSIPGQDKTFPVVVGPLSPSLGMSFVPILMKTYTFTQATSIVLILYTPCFMFQSLSIQACDITCCPSMLYKGTARQCVVIKRNGLEMQGSGNGLELQGSAWLLEEMVWYCKALCHTLSHPNQTKLQLGCYSKMVWHCKECVVIQRNGLGKPGSGWLFKGMAWHCKAVGGNSKEWSGTERKDVEMQRNGLALQDSAWQLKAVCGNYKEWTGTARQWMELKRSCLELQGSHSFALGRTSMKFQDILFHCHKLPCSARQFLCIPILSLAVLVHSFELPPTSLQCQASLRIATHSLAVPGHSFAFLGDHSPELPSTALLCHTIPLNFHALPFRPGHSFAFPPTSFQFQTIPLNGHTLPCMPGHSLSLPHTALQCQLIPLNCDAPPCIPVHSLASPHTALQSQTIPSNSHALVPHTAFQSQANPLNCHVQPCMQFHFFALSPTALECQAIPLICHMLPCSASPLLCVVTHCLAAIPVMRPTQRTRGGFGWTKCTREVSKMRTKRKGFEDVNLIIFNVSKITNLGSRKVTNRAMSIGKVEVRNPQY
ncbi:hypothetical protein VP01_2159g1 [Puccinia sorghi]|uniref:Uncharacterized protein n=1 Tax=Puccinia sorghi TaxID=27349 RepID=A0A0L6VA72_9BASI|nr:hypothetical protein VP01_2159g1 [Puccinia sorghi]